MNDKNKEKKIMSTEKKVTKKEMFEGIKATLIENFGDEVQEYVEFIDKEVAAIDARSEKEKARRAEKKAEGDELQAAVKEVVLSADGTITPEAIAEDLVDRFEDVTKNKVVYRANQLVKAGEIYKVSVKNEEGKKIVAYASEPLEEDAE